MKGETADVLAAVDHAGELYRKALGPGYYVETGAGFMESLLTKVAAALARSRQWSLAEEYFERTKRSMLSLMEVADAPVVAVDEALVACRLRDVSRLPKAFRASSTYEDQYMLLMEEVWNTRPSNFLWMEYPQFIQPLHFQRLSEKLNQLLSPPPSWNVPPGLSIPIFNPSIVAIDEPQLAGAFLLTARMSNGPGCPHFQTAEYNSLNSGVLRNQLIVALLDETFDIIDATVVDFPDTFVATYEDSAVHRVEGPMDVRLSKGPRNDSWWITFFAEQNDVPGPHRGIHLAPLHVTLTGCEDVSDRGWVEDNAASPCPILNVYHPSRSCIEECTSLGGDETEVNGDYCICRKCRGTAVTPARIHKRHGIAALAHKEGSVCIEKAYVDVREIVSVGDTGRTEKNWQILELSVDVSEVWVHYSIQPSIKVRISLAWPEGITRNDE
ncbi:hypothetical protein FOZ62_003769, partial [Perkinsus olseni]